MKMNFQVIEPPPGVKTEDWLSWKWQLKSCLRSKSDYESYFELSDQEVQGFLGADKMFKVSTTPYYASLAKSKYGNEDPIRKILMPSSQELISGSQQMLDPLGENKNNPVPRIIHRYTDRVLFLVTDHCSVYCRYCTRKHFTAKGHSVISNSEYERALEYISKHPEISEVILSGGDPLTLSDQRLDQILSDIRSIEHVEIIRIGSRMPVVAPMRVTESLVRTLKKHSPVFMMTHFNHPRELTDLAACGIGLFVDHGIPVFNQMVLLNGVNNHAVIVKALSRKLLYLRAKPYYMFQCDPSLGTDHLRTSIEDSLEIQKELWGHLSGLAMPNLSLDIPDGGGKVPLVPDFEIDRDDKGRVYRGWDGVEAPYINPPTDSIIKPADAAEY